MTKYGGHCATPVPATRAAVPLFKRGQGDFACVPAMSAERKSLPPPSRGTPTAVGGTAQPLQGDCSDAVTACINRRILNKEY